MSASFALRPLRHLVCMLALLIAPALLAQVDNVYVYGTVKDYVSSKKLDGVTVTVFKNGGKLAEVITSASGKYEFNLDYGSEYKLVYSKTGVVSKNITIDTRNIPEEERVGGHGMNVEMTLFSELPGIDFSVLQQPIGKAHFDPTTKEVTWDLVYTEQIKAEITRLMKEYDEKKKREAGAAEDFNKLMAQGDAYMTSADYSKAVETFTSALAMKPGDAKATARLSDAKMKLEDLTGEKKRNEQYAALVKEADGLFGKKDYAGAKAKYSAALDLKELEPYPKQKLKECDTLLDELAKQAEIERKKKELDDKYSAAIAAGDAMFKGEKYEDAQARYGDASALKPAEKYPKDQMALIAKKLEDLAKKAEEERKAKEAEAKYKATIVAADAAFNAANYDQAKTKYTEALGMKPAEKYPKDQLATIAKKLDELAKKAEDEKKQKAIDDAYTAAITAADAAFHADKFDVAKAQYTAALAVKAKEKYPQDQLAAIDKRIAELAKLAEEERKKKELDTKYNAAITAADAAFHGAKWDEAKTQYTAALAIKAQEQYPKDQIAAIDKTIADAAKKAEDEKKLKELDAQYQKLLGDADKLFSLDKLPDARAKYTEASVVKPSESRPKERIAEIDAKLADQAREAEEERKQKELDAKYKALITKADKEFDTKKFPDALNDYKDALAVKADEQHPKDRIAEINGKMDAHGSSAGMQ